MRQRMVACMMALASLFAAPQAEAQVDLDVGRSLNRPKVKLVLVEFYATWCSNCRELRSIREVNGSDRHMQQLL
jgi:thiol-disulfide isomerase/thioredoxin